MAVRAAGIESKANQAGDSDTDSHLPRRLRLITHGGCHTAGDRLSAAETY